jgi:hypothetical protein
VSKEKETSSIKVDLFGPDCHKRIQEAIDTKNVIEVELPDDYGDEQILNGEISIPGVAVIRIKVSPIKLAMYRDPITRRKAGHAPQKGCRKKSFPYPDASIANEAMHTLQWRFIGCDPATLRMIALVAEPESIQVGGDGELLSRLISQARFTMNAFKIKRLREPFERFICAIQHAQKKSSTDIW